MARKLLFVMLVMVTLIAIHATGLDSTHVIHAINLVNVIIVTAQVQNLVTIATEMVGYGMIAALAMAPVVTLSVTVGTFGAVYAMVADIITKRIAGPAVGQVWLVAMCATAADNVPSVEEKDMLNVEHAMAPGLVGNVEEKGNLNATIVQVQDYAPLVKEVKLYLAVSVQALVPIKHSNAYPSRKKIISIY